MRNFIKKTIASLLIMTIVTGGLAVVPREVRAQAGVIEVNSTASLFKQIATTFSAVGTAFSTYSLQYKGFVLDTIATTIAKQIIRQLTASVVNWINTGFEGSPSFMTNPGAFFLDVADQITGEFLDVDGGFSPLRELCSPFSIDIRLALMFKYHPKDNKKYTCTLGAIIKNSKNAITGASINGFTAGDFRQGGWPAFISLTESQNNIYGTYLTAESELSIRVAGAQLQKKDELNQGSGFLSWRNPKCAKGVAEHNAALQKKSQDSPDGTYLQDIENQANAENSPDAQYLQEVGGERNTLKSKNDCPVETPGSVIVDSLQNSIGGPLRELELVDSINEIVGALAAKLVSTMLQGGLKAVSGSGPSDSSSYLNKIQIEASAMETGQVETLRNSFIQSVGKYIIDTLQYKTHKDKSLNLILEVKNKYDEVTTCYNAHLAKTQPPITAPEKSLAENRKADVDTVVKTKVTPLATKLLNEATKADTNYTTLTKLRDQANAAKTVNDLREPSSAFSAMLQEQSLISANDIVSAQQEFEETTTTVKPLKEDAVRKLQACQIFPNVVGGNF